MALDLDELVEHWTLLADEREQVASKRGASSLGFALLLKFFTPTDSSRDRVRKRNPSTGSSE